MLGFVRRWTRWDVPERRLLLKMDFFVLSFLCLQLFVNYLDRANFANAYVSGLQKALNFRGRQFNYVNACFTAGYGFSQIPQNILLLYVRPRILFPVNGVIWGILTICSAAATKVWHLYLIKFLQGCAEASTFVGANYVMGSWYQNSELCKRVAIFLCAGQISYIFSGVLQSAIHTRMDGLSNIAGWRWNFIICGVVTIPVALYGAIVFPDTPETTVAGYFTENERRLALERVPPPKGTTKVSFPLLKKMLSRWPIYVMPVLWIAGGALEAVLTNSLMALWMYHQFKAPKVPMYTVSQINLFPGGCFAVAIASLLLAAFWTDRTGKRYQINIIIALTMIVAASLLLNYDHISTKVKFFAFYISGVSFSGQATNFAWASEISRGNDAERAILISTMNMVTFAVNTGLSLTLFNAAEAPKWHQGMISILVMAPCMIILTCTARWLQLREQRGLLRDQENRSSETQHGKEEEVEDDSN
ncbi:MFS general substrate transporter [Meredithblackwellia eburnea MCA 4105]